MTEKTTILKTNKKEKMKITKIFRLVRKNGCECFRTMYVEDCKEKIKELKKKYPRETYRIQIQSNHSNSAVFTPWRDI